ncbi:hypothetical protein [Spirochaeta isovalerica]|uniref:Uncharacterized protein n=1 Tax=Spirochaeta isovalerica TaxID=150 RepID=A0A841RDT0_9SPIO|nr:hypothetical protein [Spirochaeta isovalerica]MBB6481541.1 hypothetical protein [Spirochaeta isovalerica]
MPEITLICTQHAEKGACNFHDLYHIVEQIQPDVIFEELPPSAYNDFYIEKTRDNLETRTINAYIEKHPIEHVPIDLELDLTSFFEKNGRLHHRIEANSRDYRSSVDWNTQYVYQYGFKYLNSEHCEKITSQIDNAIDQTLDKLKDEKLNQIFNEWNDVIERREQEMISNIYQYCRDHDFERGLFFIGAAHRKSIIEMIQARFKDDGVNWKYENYNGIL